MKNFEKLIFVSTFFVTSLACAQNYGYDQSNQSQQGYKQSYPSSQPSQQGQYRNGTAKDSNDQNSWSNWFDGDNTPKVPDDIITTKVIQNLRSTPYFSDSAKNIKVTAKDGKVTLKGKTANKNEKNQIEYMVKNVEGVRSVSNDLETEK